MWDVPQGFLKLSAFSLTLKGTALGVKSMLLVLDFIGGEDGLACYNQGKQPLIKIDNYGERLTQLGARTRRAPRPFLAPNLAGK